MAGTERCLSRQQGNQRLRVALAQINSIVGDFAGNQSNILQALAHCQSRTARLIVFPELALTGYPPEDLLFKRSFIKANFNALEAIIPAVGDCVALIGCVERDERGRLYNAAAVICRQKLMGFYRKAKLPNFGVFDERRYFTPGSDPLIVGVGGVRIGLAICQDLWEKESVHYRADYVQSVSILASLSASPFHMGKQLLRQKMVTSLARRIGAAVIYQNLVGGQDELVFDGGSLIADPAGRLIGRAARFEEDILIADVPVRPASSLGPPPAGVRTLSLPIAFGSVKKSHSTKSRLSPSLGPDEEVYRALVLGTRDYILKNGFQKVLIGLSGGIDSALVARIAVDALGPRQVIAVTMPSPFTSSQTLADAKRLARQLGIVCFELRINEVFEAYLTTLKPAFEGTVSGVAEENLQARIRGNLLMALSNKYGYLVLTTGNKSETATGYCTLYGDMAGGFAVIKDVPKTTVYRLARYRNRIYPKRSIAQSIIARAPTAELKIGQKDQDTLPPYAILDRFIRAYIEQDLSVEQIVKEGIASATIAKKIARMTDLNEYKRRQAPPGIKITPKAFGRDRRMPITNRFVQ
ncbi:MAG: NAD+ synthase [Candidatus Omnitrophota bacterium]